MTAAMGKERIRMELSLVVVTTTVLCVHFMASDTGGWGSRKNI